MAVIEEIHQAEEHKQKPTRDMQQRTPVTNETTAAAADEDGDVFYDSIDYEPDEFERLVAEATEYKKAGNTFFAQGEFAKAVSEYEDALVVCPLSATQVRAVCFGNIAACYLKQDQYKDARDMATQALKLDQGYSKALLRRAQANEKINTSSSLSDALEDYRKLGDQRDLDVHTKRQCERAKQQLPALIKEAMEKEKDEMLGKLKDLGNTLLGKFGLSTDNFQLQQDPNSGGYSVNFVNNR
ncbi:hypothetical protein BX666DRAFT_1879378 [Dichotomocladium elegans]|nr:hypothetical protein BX666DRAFT_1879378 [Dichotomocladium elegans]